MSSIYESDSSSDSNGEEITEEQTVDESKDLRDALGDIPLGEIQKLKETVSLKKYNEAIFGMAKKNKHSLDDDNDDDDHNNKRNQQLKRKLETEKKKKSEPEEFSSKRKIFRPRKVIEEVKRKHRDPRFDNLSGTFNESMFQKSYDFVNDMKKEELKTVKKQFKKARNKEQKSSLHKLLQRMEEQEKFEAKQTKRKEVEKKRRHEEYDANKNRKKAFYMKKSEAKKLELVEQYQKLQKSGQLDKYMRNKRKTITSKEKKKFLA